MARRGAVMTDSGRDFQRPADVNSVAYPHIVKREFAMRPIDTIVIHCSATMEGRPFTVDDIDKMHRRLGWNGVGYHYVIKLDGTSQVGRQMDTIGSHVQGHNSKSIGICYIGGIGANGKAKDTRTEAQKVTLQKLITELRIKYPAAKFVGHRDLSPDKDGDGVVEPHEWLKQCPCFDVRAWCKSVGIDPK